MLTEAFVHIYFDEYIRKAYRVDTFIGQEGWYQDSEGNREHFVVIGHSHRIAVRFNDSGREAVIHPTDPNMMLGAPKYGVALCHWLCRRMEGPLSDLGISARIHTAPCYNTIVFRFVGRVKGKHAEYSISKSAKLMEGCGIAMDERRFIDHKTIDMTERVTREFLRKSVEVWA